MDLFSAQEPEHEDDQQQQIPTVGQLTRQISGMLETRFNQVVVQGEISGWSRAASGHTYFALKDDEALLSAVLWKSRVVSPAIRDGMKVIARGRISVYPPRGQYQLDCVSLMPLGQGELQLAYERLKAQLLEEGLFDQDRKRPLPRFPKKIGIVTSKTGAAIQDIISTLQRRMPTVHVLLRPALVQGLSAAEDVAAAIKELGERDDLDIIIVGRGGGSIEDLWAFNEEIVARAIANSPVPVISAVGHETDFTIADFVADLRAPTPTAAAELAVPDQREVIGMLYDVEERLHTEMSDKLYAAHRELQSLIRSRGMARPATLIRTHQQRTDELTHRLGLGVRNGLHRTSERLRSLESSLRTLNPKGVLARGYAIVERNGETIMRSSSLSTGDHISVTMYDGARKALVTE